jgi:ZIP family zinc transporter
MNPDLPRILTLTAIPVFATILGGVLAAYRPPGERLQSLFQHLAAGVVLAAVAGEILPEVDRLHDSKALILGFSAGVALLLALEQFLGGLRREAEGQSRGAVSAFPTALVVIVGADVFIDGLLIGSSFGAGERVGLLLTLALTVELLFLGLGTAAVMVRNGVGRATVVAAVSLIALGLAAGALVGGGLLAGLRGFWLELVLSFGAAALPYLVVEELLTEAHRVGEPPRSRRPSSSVSWPCTRSRPSCLKLGFV